MKRQMAGLPLFLCLVIGGIASAEHAQQDIVSFQSCRLCGMDRGSLDFSRVLIEYDDGTNAAFCSLHCAAVDLAVNIDKIPKAIKVGDFKSKQLIDAENSFWVLGGDKPGVMSRRGKWAFKIKEDAEAFISSNRGTMASFEEVMKMAYEDMYEDTRMIREKRKAKRQKVTEKKI